MISIKNFKNFSRAIKVLKDFVVTDNKQYLEIQAKNPKLKVSAEKA